MNDIEAIDDTAVAANRIRGPSYSKTEDLLIARAFVGASETPRGTSMKGKVFHALMYEFYTAFIAEQVEIDALALYQPQSRKCSSMFLSILSD
jgi:hypothetical protein